MKEKKDILLIIGAIIIIFICVLAVNFLPNKTNENKNHKEDLLGIDYKTESNEGKLDYDTENPLVAMYIEEYGSIVMELFPDVAPNTVNNFISLVKSGFYDKNTIHRLMPGFVLQGGDPTGTGSGGPDYTIKGEFTSNGFENKLSHTKGIISMARSTEKDSAGSQFFIVLEDAKTLDEQYATFGRVIDGWDNIEAITKNEKIKDIQTGKLAKNLVIKKAIIDLKGKEYKEVEKIRNN